MEGGIEVRLPDEKDNSNPWHLDKRFTNWAIIILTVPGGYITEKGEFAKSVLT